MKILILSDYSTPTAGHELMCLELREELRRRREDCLWLSSDARPTQQSALAADILFPGRFSPSGNSNEVANLQGTWVLQKVLRDFRPDVVHIANMEEQVSQLACWALRNENVLYHAGWDRCFDSRGTRWGALRVFLQQRTLRKFAVYGCSRYIRSMFRYRGLKAGVLHSPVRSSSLAELNGLTKEPTISFSGRLDAVKGVDTLISALSLTRRRFRLLAAGEVEAGNESYLSLLQGLACRLGVEVEFLGFLSREEQDFRFHSAWMHAIPSRKEPWGRVSIEAQLRGQPVIASHVGGLPETMREFSGLCVGLSSTELAAGIDRLAENIVEVSRKAGARKAWAGLFTWDMYFPRFMEAYRTVVQQ